MESKERKYRLKNMSSDDSNVVVSLHEYRQSKKAQEKEQEKNQQKHVDKKQNELEYVRKLTHLILTNTLELLEKEGYDINLDDVLDHCIGGANMIQAGLIQVHGFEHPLEHIYSLAMEDTATELMKEYGKDYKKPTNRELAVIDLTKYEGKEGK